MRDIHLDLSSVSEQMRRGYDGRKFRARVVKQVEIPIDSWLWSSGSRNTFRTVRIADGTEVALSSLLSPFDPARTGKVIQLTPSITVVDESKFQGKNMGLRFHVHADYAGRMLPVAVELTATERTVLNRILPMTAQYRDDERRRAGISNADFDAAVDRFIELKLWQTTGGFTTAGKNARSAQLTRPCRTPCF